MGDELLIDKELRFAFRDDAYYVEQRLHDHFKKLQAFSSYNNDKKQPLAGRVQTELFQHDVLGLDDDLCKAQPLSLSAKEATELEEQSDGCMVMTIGVVLAPFTLGLSLLFLFVGGSAFFGSGAKPSAQGPLNPRRPIHPEEIQAVIEELKRTCKLRCTPPGSGALSPAPAPPSARSFSAG